nr:putative capsid protein [Crucivirus sp.]
MQRRAYFARKSAAVSGRGAYHKAPAKRAPAKKPAASRSAPRSSQPWLAPALGVVGSAIGTAVGGPAGGLVGNAAGQAAGSIIRHVTGYGAYKVRSNVLYEGAQIPMVRNRSVRNGTVIRHREYLMDVISSSSASTFNIQSFSLNPGQEGTFPWLAQIASNYEEFIIEGCLFEFRSLSGDALTSTNTALGSVIMATNYNAANAAFASKAEMESYEYSMSCKPSESMIHPIECDPRQTPISELYIRPGSVPSGQDVRLYDLGIFQIATTGMQGTSVNLGELWISYQVSLLKPKLFATLGLLGGFWKNTATTGVTNAQPLGTTPVASSSSNLAITFTGAGFNVINFPLTSAPQAYEIYFRWVGGSVVWVPPAVSFSGMTALSVYAGGTVDTPSSGATATTVSKICSFLTNGQYQLPTLTIGTAGTLPTAVSAFEMVVSQIPNNAN